MLNLTFAHTLRTCDTSFMIVSMSGSISDEVQHISVACEQVAVEQTLPDPYSNPAFSEKAGRELPTHVSPMARQVEMQGPSCTTAPASSLQQAASSSNVLRADGSEARPTPPDTAVQPFQVCTRTFLFAWMDTYLCI